MRDTRIVGWNRGFKNGREKAPNFERYDRIVATLTTKFAEWRISSCLGQLRRAGAGGLVLDKEQSQLGHRMRNSEDCFAPSKEWGKESVYATKGDDCVSWVGKVK